MLCRGIIDYSYYELVSTYFSNTECIEDVLASKKVIRARMILDLCFERIRYCLGGNSTVGVECVCILK